MIITWLGHSCFKLQDKLGTGGITLTTDPFDKEIGLKTPNFESDIVTVSHDHHDHNNISSLRGESFVIDCPGEFDYKDVLVQGIYSCHDEKDGADRGANTIYRIEMDDLSICHLGDLGHSLNDEQLNKLSGIDILFIPVGGKYTLDAKKAVEVISQIEPRMVIPMHYKVDGLNLDIDSIEPFIKELGIKPTYEEKLKISKKDLPQEDMELVILSI